MYYVDDKGKVLDIQTPLTEALNAVIEDYFDCLLYTSDAADE